MKKICTLLSLAVLLAACSDSDDPVLTQTKTVDFEQAALGEQGFIWGKELATEQDDVDYQGNPIRSNIYYGELYAEDDASFYTYFSDYGHTYDSWNGFVVSNHNDTTTAGYTNDKSVYADGAKSGLRFAVGYYGSWTADGKGIPVVHFTAPVRPVSVCVAHTTYGYLYFQELDAAERSAFEVKATGYNGTTATGSVSLPLVAGTAPVEGWQTLPLAELGPVTSIEFTIQCADFNAPLYFCLDDLVYTI